MPLKPSPSRPRAFAWLVVAALAPASTLAPGSASADPASTSSVQCEPAYEGAQLERQRGHLREARDQAALCARAVCPEEARRDCARWVDELGRDIPTVVVVARDAQDRDVPGLHILVDGAPRDEVATGRAFELDPGAHVFRVERPGSRPATATFTVVQGERGRILRLPLPGVPGGSTAASAGGSSAEDLAPSAGPTGDDRPRPSVVPALVVGGLSVAALATSAVLGWTGRQQLSDLRSTCAPTCSDAQVGPVRTRLLISDIALGGGLVGAALATYLFAVRGTF